MALQTRAIKEKIGSVKNIGKITRAMELVSVSKMKRATQAALATRPFARHALELLVSVAEQEIVRHPLLRHGNDEKNLIILVSSNKGLCGSYNVNVAKSAKRFIGRIKAKHKADISFVAVGKRSEKIARSIGGDVVASFVDLPEEITLGDIAPIAQVAGEEFRTGNYFNVVVVYTNYISALSNEVHARQLLPVSMENIRNMIYEAGDDRESEVNGEGGISNYLFEPTEEEVVDHVLSELSVVQIYQALLEARASEHSARMMAMKSATENSEKLAEELTLTYNRARQASITQEISEIASGAEALNK